MKKAALRRGAELAPISSTLGIESGRGVVSIKTFWLKLGPLRSVIAASQYAYNLQINKVLTLDSVKTYCRFVITEETRS